MANRMTLSIKARLVFFTVCGLLIFNYGFMQLRVASVPLAEIILLLFLLTANLPVLLRRFSYTLNSVPIYMWWCFGLFSAGYYLSINGIWALRDASQVIESLYILVGFSVFSVVNNRRYILSKYPGFIFILCIYALTYPFSVFLKSLSPTIVAGAGHSTPILFNYTNSSMMLLLGALFLVVSVRNDFIFQKYGVVTAAILLLFSVGFFQARTLYLQIIGLVVILLYVKPSVAKQWLYILMAALLLLLLVSFSGLEIEGRLGQRLSGEFLVNHVGTIFGVESAGLEGTADGIGQRIGWWLDIYDRLSADLIAMLVGLGFGFPLVDFGIAHGVMVREPHNSYISILARTGLLGFLLWLWMHWQLFKCWRFSHQKCKQFQWRAGEKMLIMMLAYFVFIWCLAIGEDAFEKPYNAVPYYFFWGIVIRIAWFAKHNMIRENGIINQC